MQKDYNMLDINNKLIWNLRDIGHTLRHVSEGKGSQKRVLIILNETGMITQRDLTERLGIRPGSASEVFGKLEKGGLIRRSPYSMDHRTINISLTPSGREQALLAAEKRRLRHEDMFSGLSDEEKASLLILTEKLNCDWKKRYLEAEIKCAAADSGREN